MRNAIIIDGLYYEAEHVRAGEIVQRCTTHNLVPAEGLTHIGGMIAANGAVPVSSWHLGLFSGSYAPTGSVKAADLQSPVNEFAGYANAARPTWNAQYDGSGLITAPSASEFEINADADINGAFVVSSGTKGGNSGLLLSIVRFASPFSVTDGSTFRLRAYLSLTALEV